MTVKRKNRRGRKKLRVLVLMHEDLVPPEDIKSLGENDFHRIKTECDILKALAKLGHEAKALGVRDAVLPIRRAVEEWEPDIVFNRAGVLKTEENGSALCLNCQISRTRRHRQYDRVCE